MMKKAKEIWAEKAKHRLWYLRTNQGVKLILTNILSPENIAFNYSLNRKKKIIKVIPDEERNLKLKIETLTYGPGCNQTPIEREISVALAKYLIENWQYKMQLLNPGFIEKKDPDGIIRPQPSHARGRYRR